VDYLKAKELGFNAHPIPAPSLMLRGENPGLYSGQWYSKLTKGNKLFTDINSSLVNYIHMSAMLGLAANKFFDNPFVPFHKESDYNINPNMIGYLSLGMHLVAVAKWLLQKSKERNKKLIAFTARDGFFLKKVYDIIVQNETSVPLSSYIYTSRKSLLDLDISSSFDLYSLQKKINLHSWTPKKFVNILGKMMYSEQQKNVQELCEKAHFPWIKTFETYENFSHFIDFFVENLCDAESHNVYVQRIKQYFEDLIGDDSFIFDMGYAGRGEATLAQLLGKHISALYIYKTSDIVSLRARKAGFSVETFYDYAPKTCVVVREHVFSEQAPSCIGYGVSSDGENVTPQFDDEYTNNYQNFFVTDKIHEAAISFAKDYVDTFGQYLDDFDMPYTLLSTPFEFLLHFPTAIDTEIFGCSYFEDDAHGGSRSINIRDFWKNDLQAHGLHQTPYQPPPSQTQPLSPPQTQPMSLRRKILNKILPVGSMRRRAVKKLVSPFIRVINKEF
jgi:hypothetical protein